MVLSRDGVAEQPQTSSTPPTTVSPEDGQDYHIRQAIDEVYYGVKEPKEALDDAAAKSALVLGW